MAVTVCGAMTRATCSTKNSMRSRTARISLRACVIGLPVSDVVAAAQSSIAASRRSAKSSSTTARSSKLRAAHAGCAARARRTFVATVASSSTSSSRITAPVAGLRTGIGRGVAGAGVKARSGRGSDDTPTAPVPPKIGRDADAGDETDGAGVVRGRIGAAAARSADSSTGVNRWAQRLSFCPGRRARCTTNARSGAARRSSTASTSLNDAKG